ncbi:MAG: hypothetical protein ABFS16_12705 [Bacteroidota bacterium]
MKKVLLVLALVAAYGVSLAVTNISVETVKETVTIVADVNDNNVTPDKEEDKKAKAESKSKGCADSKTESKGCSGDKTAKADDCEGKSKKDCSSKCSGKKK